MKKKKGGGGAGSKERTGVERRSMLAQSRGKLNGLLHDFQLLIKNSGATSSRDI